MGDFKPSGERSIKGNLTAWTMGDILFLQIRGPLNRDMVEAYFEVRAKYIAGIADHPFGVVVHYLESMLLDQEGYEARSRHTGEQAQPAAIAYVAAPDCVGLLERVPKLDELYSRLNVPHQWFTSVDLGMNFVRKNLDEAHGARAATDAQIRFVGEI